MSTTRRSKRSRRYVTHRDLEKSALQIQLRRAIESPGGTQKVLRLVQRASDDEIEELNRAQWTPLVGAIFRLGKCSTRHGNAPRSEEQLLDLVRACHRRGIDANSIDVFGGTCHRPLIVAAYYGYASAARLLLESGALPDLRDGEGRNAWCAAFESPVFSRGGRRFRDCDRRTARALLDAGGATNELGLWKRRAKGSVCYINEWYTRIGSSVMCRALKNKNVQVVRFLRDAGCVVTDRDYLSLSRNGRAKNWFLPLVREVACNRARPESNAIENESQSLQRDISPCDSWNSKVDWSFPPTWKVGVALCQNLGLPRDIFRQHVVPFLGRDWFYPARRNPASDVGCPIDCGRVWANHGYDLPVKGQN